MPPAPRRRAPRQPRARTTYHHGDLRRALLDAARTLLAEKGAAGITLREAARAVGVDHSAVYRHFADKRALLAGLCERCYRDLLVALAAAMRDVPAADVPERLRRLGTAFLRFARADPARFELMFGPRLNLDGRFPALDAVTDETLAALIAEMERAVAAGHFAPARPVDLAIAFWTMLQGYADLVLRRRIKVRSARAAEAYLDTLLAPLLAGMAGEHPAGPVPR